MLHLQHNTWPGWKYAIAARTHKSAALKKCCQQKHLRGAVHSTKYSVSILIIWYPTFTVCLVCACGYKYCQYTVYVSQEKGSNSHYRPEYTCISPSP